MLKNYNFMHFKKHTTLLLLAAIIIVISCKKQEAVSEKKSQIDVGSIISNYLEKNMNPKDGIISIIARTPIDAHGVKQAPDMMIDAQFYNDHNPESPFFAGDLKVGSLSIPFFNKANGLPSGYNLQTAVNVDKSDLGPLKAIWGTKVRFKVTPQSTSNYALNSVFPTVVKTNGFDENGFYIPQQMEFVSDFTGSGNYYVSVNNASNIYWTPDLNNPSGTVMIGVIRESDPNNPAEVVLFKEIPDNGSYSLTSEDMQALTVGGLASVFLARGNYTVYSDPITSNQVLIGALTYATVSFLGVMN